MCCIRNGGRAPNDALTLSCTTHSVDLATIESARLRAYSSPASRPAATSAMTMTTTRTMDSGSRNRFLIFTNSEESFCGGSAGAPCGGGGGWPGGGPCGNCGGGGTCGAWLAGRAQGSVTSAILPYRDMCGYS